MCPVRNVNHVPGRSAGPLAFDLPRLVWKIIFCLGLLITIFAAIRLVYEYRELSRHKLTKRAVIIGSFLSFSICMSVWYFWPDKAKQIDAMQGAERTHISAKLFVDSDHGPFVNFHVVLENIGDTTIDNLTREYRSGEYVDHQNPISGRESFPITMAPRGKAGIYGFVPNDPKSVLKVDLTAYYRVLSGDAVHYLNTRFGFIVPKDQKNGEGIDPVSIQESVGPNPSYDNFTSFVNQLKFDKGTTSIKLSLKPKGMDPLSELKIVSDNKYVMISFVLNIATFSITFKDGLTKQLLMNIVEKNESSHIFLFTWDESKHLADLGVDGALWSGLNGDSH